MGWRQDLPGLLEHRLLRTRQLRQLPSAVAANPCTSVQLPSHLAPILLASGASALTEVLLLRSVAHGLRTTHPFVATHKTPVTSECQFQRLAAKRPRKCCAPQLFSMHHGLEGVQANHKCTIGYEDWQNAIRVANSEQESTSPAVQRHL